MREQTKFEPTEWVFTAKIRLKNGHVIYARNYGLKAFRFPKVKKWEISPQIQNHN